MNYIGRVLEENFKPEVLKQALQHVEESMPYRGPRIFVMDDYTYVCDYSGVSIGLQEKRRYYISKQSFMN